MVITVLFVIHSDRYYGHRCHNSCWNRRPWNIQSFMRGKKRDQKTSLMGWWISRTGLLTWPILSNFGRLTAKWILHAISTQLAGVVDFDAKANGLKGKTINRNARYTHFALVAARQAIADAKIDITAIDNERFGCIVGSGIGGVEWFENNCNAFYGAGGGYASLRMVDQFLIPALISNTASGMIAIEQNAKGPNYCVTTACATGTHAIGAALKHMRDGEADIMIAGGSEAALTPLCYAGFCALTAMVSKYNDTPEKASRPFDKDRWYYRVIFFTITVTTSSSSDWLTMCVSFLELVSLWARAAVWSLWRLKSMR